MNKKTSLLLGALLVSVATSLPTSPAHAFLNDREDLGTLLGAISGGFIGNEIGQGDGRVAATAVGAVTGSLLGRSVGQSLDRAEYTYARPSYNNYGYASRPALYSSPPPQVVYVAPSYEQRVGSYAAVPAPSYAYYGPPSHQQRPYCREFTHRVSVGNRPADSYGTACLQPDGSWQIVGER